uniref:Uncharacterized protein n=1 Tax=Rhizophora mucronata TaxID=61149 RepID=A0A2P2NTM2_RHIMU
MYVMNWQQTPTMQIQIIMQKSTNKKFKLPFR